MNTLTLSTIKENCKFIFPLLSVSAALVLTGCTDGTDSATERYREKVEAFSADMDTLSASINGISPEDESSTETMLGYLDDMDQRFAEMAALEVPEKYSDASGYMTAASQSMSDAVLSFHVVYESSDFDEALADKAMAKYRYAFECVEQMCNIFEGQQASMPEAPSE